MNDLGNLFDIMERGHEAACEIQRCREFDAGVARAEEIEAEAGEVWKRDVADQNDPSLMRFDRFTEALAEVIEPADKAAIQRHLRERNYSVLGFIVAEIVEAYWQAHCRIDGEALVNARNEKAKQDAIAERSFWRMR